MCCSSVNAVLGYDFIVNAVWPEIVSSLEFRIPSLFAPGDPELFHEVCSPTIFMLFTVSDCFWF